MTGIHVKRLYDKRAEGDGFRVLIDRLWPRGLTKEGAHIDCWLKEIAPSTALRQWFSHDPHRWETFKTRYFLEIAEQEGAVKYLAEKLEEGNVTLLYAAKNRQFNHAVALREWLEKLNLLEKQK